VTPGSALACRALGLRRGRLVLQRDVRIFAGGRARVSARTVAAYGERSAALALLQGLGGRSLGQALFAPRGRLTARRVDACFAPPDAAGLPAVADLPGAWARCTRWRVRHDLLAVTEVFHVTQPDEAPQPPR
jgi:chorismate-pyruvate lyase